MTFVEVYRPGTARMEMHLHYFNGDCNSPETQAQIRQNFIKILNGSIFKDVCQDPSLKDKCKAENVKVTCAAVDFDINRKKRDAGIFSVQGADLSNWPLYILIMRLLWHRTVNQLQLTENVISNKPEMIYLFIYLFIYYL